MTHLGRHFILECEKRCIQNGEFMILGLDQTWSWVTPTYCRVSKLHSAIPHCYWHKHRKTIDAKHFGFRENNCCRVYEWTKCCSKATASLETIQQSQTWKFFRWWKKKAVFYIRMLTIDFDYSQVPKYGFKMSDSVPIVRFKELFKRFSLFANITSLVLLWFSLSRFHGCLF